MKSALKTSYGLDSKASYGLDADERSSSSKATAAGYNAGYSSKSYGLDSEATAATPVAKSGGEPYKGSSSSQLKDSKPGSYGLDAEPARKPVASAGYGLGAEASSTNKPANNNKYGLEQESPRSKPAAKYGLDEENSSSKPKPVSSYDAPRTSSPGKAAGSKGYGLDAEASHASSRPHATDHIKTSSYGLDAETKGHGNGAAGKQQEVYGMSRPRDTGSPRASARKHLIAQDAGGAGQEWQRRRAGPDMPRMSGAGPMNLQEVTQSGRPYLLDRTSGLVYKDVSAHAAPELAGKWVGERVVFTPPTTEMELYTELAAYLELKELALEDVFAALDGDLDGCLRTGPGSAGYREMGRLVLDVMPGLPTSSVQLFCTLADFDGDGYVSLQDLQAAGGYCFEAACEYELGGRSALATHLHEVAVVLTDKRAHCQLVASSLDVERLGWLEPAGWVRFLRAVCPHLSPCQLRYVMAHIYFGPEDNRKSLTEITRAVISVDEQYSAMARSARGAASRSRTPTGRAGLLEQGGGDIAAVEVRARARARSEAVMGVLRRPGYSGSTPPKAAQEAAPASPGRQAGGVTGTQGKQQAAAPASISLVTNPRGAVSAWFSALAVYLDRQPGSQAPGQKGLALRSLLRACDNNDDGYLDNAGMRTLVQTIMPAVTEAQIVYIKAALNPSNSHLISYEEVTRSLARFSAGLAWDTPHGGRAPLDSLHILATFLQDNKAKLQVLMSMFDSDGDGLLGEVDLMRLLRFVQPTLRDRQLDLCLAQLRSQVDRDRDGLISVHDLRLALQRRQESVAALRAQAAAASGVGLIQHNRDGLYGTPDHRYTPAVPQAADDLALMSTDPWDPFTLAGLAALQATENASQLPAHIHTASQRQNSQHASLTASRTKAWGNPAQVVRDDNLGSTQVLGNPPAHLDPLTYCGYSYLHDPVSNLVYLPVRNAPGSAQDGAPLEIKGSELAVLQQQCTLLLFGRLRPDKHVQRVETAAANALFTALDQQLKASKQTLDKLISRFTSKHLSSGGKLPANRPGHGAPSIPPATPCLDLIGVKELIQALVPAWAAGRGVVHYFMALFDLDGDGKVDVDDMMDAFEEAGTNVDTLQTPAHVVHAKAYKLLARLASHVTRSPVQEDQAAALFHKLDSHAKGGLTLPELSRFISELSFKAAHSQAESQNDLIGQPTALPVQATSGAYAGNALAAGASSDDVGALCVFLSSKVLGGDAILSWAALLQVMRQASTQLPTEIRDGSLQRAHSPSRHTHIAPPAPQYIAHGTTMNTPGRGAKVYDVEQHHRQQYSARDQYRPEDGSTSTLVRPVPASATGTLPGGGTAYTESHSMTSVIGGGMKPGASYPAEVHHHHHHHHRHVYVQGQTDTKQSPRGLSATASLYADDAVLDGSLVTGRYMPLRGDNGFGAGQRGPQPGRRDVQLIHHTTMTSDTPGTQQQVLLLDPCTGLLYRAPSQLYDTSPPADPTRVPSNCTPWTPHALAPTSRVKAQAYARPGSGGGALPVDGGAKAGGGAAKLGYPELVGRIQAPDNRLIPAPLPSLSGLFKLLEAAAQDVYQVRTLAKMYDRDGKGLDVEGLHKLLSAMPITPAGSASPSGHQAGHSSVTNNPNIPGVAMEARGASGSMACGGGTTTGHLRISQSDLLHAALDVTGNGRVTIDELIKGISAATSNEEVTGPRVTAATQAEQRAIRVLHNASNLIAGSMRAFWLLYSQADPRGVGYIDLDVACGMLSQLMVGVPASDLELINAYLGAACLGPTRDISPDELLQLFHVLPLRYNGPLLTRKTGLTPRSNPLANAKLDADSSILASCLASDDEGVVFQPGFVPIELPVSSKTPAGHVSPRADSPHMVPAEPQYLGNVLPAYYNQPGITPEQYKVQQQQQHVMYESHHLAVWTGLSPPPPQQVQGYSSPSQLPYGAGQTQGHLPAGYGKSSAMPQPLAVGVQHVAPPWQQQQQQQPQLQSSWDVRRFPRIFTRVFPHVPSAFCSPHNRPPAPTNKHYYASRYPPIRLMPFVPVTSRKINFNQPPWYGQPPAYTQPPYRHDEYMMQQYYQQRPPAGPQGQGSWGAPGGPPQQHGYPAPPRQQSYPGVQLPYQQQPGYPDQAPYQQGPYTPRDNSYPARGPGAQYAPHLGQGLPEYEFRPRLDLEAGPPDWHVPSRGPHDNKHMPPAIRRGDDSGYGLDAESPRPSKAPGYGLDAEQPRDRSPASRDHGLYLTRDEPRNSYPARQQSYGLDEERHSPRVDVTLSKWDADRPGSSSSRYGSPGRDAGHVSGSDYRPPTPARDAYNSRPDSAYGLRADSPHGSRPPASHKDTPGSRQHSNSGYVSEPIRPQSPAILRPGFEYEDMGPGSRRPTSPAVIRPGLEYEDVSAGSRRPTSPAPARPGELDDYGRRPASKEYGLDAARPSSPAPGHVSHVKDHGKDSRGYGLDGEGTAKGSYSKWDDSPRDKQDSYGITGSSQHKPPAIKSGYGLESDSNYGLGQESSHKQPSSGYGLGSASDSKPSSYGLDSSSSSKPSGAGKNDYGLGSGATAKPPARDEYGLGSGATKPPARDEYGLGSEKPKSSSGLDKPYGSSGSKADAGRGGFGLGAEDHSSSKLTGSKSGLKVIDDDDYGLDGFEDDDSLSPSPRPRNKSVSGVIKGAGAGRPASPLPIQAKRLNSSSDDDF